MADNSPTQQSDQDDQSVSVSPSDQVTPVAPPPPSQPVSEDQIQTPPVEIQSPPEVTPSSAIGQSSNERPNTPNLANVQPPSQESPSPVTAVEKQTEPPKEEAQPQVVSPEIGQSTSPDTTWPNSPIAANTQPEETPPSVQPVSPPTEDNQPISPLPADLSAETKAQEETPKEENPPPESSPPADSSPSVSPVESTLSQTSQSESSVAENKADIPEPAKPNLSAVVPLSATKEDISITPPDNQAQQAQSEALNDASKLGTEKPQDQLASFKPEPPEQPQEAPLANTDSQTSSQKSFGDLLSSENQPPSSPSIPPIPSSPSTPSVPSPSAPVSFGDLIKDIKPEESVIPPPQNSPPIISSPINQQPPTTNQAPISSLPQTPPPPPNPPEPTIVVKEVIKEIPVVNQEEVDKQLKDKLKAEQDQRRILANQARSQKKSDNLDRIMEMAKSKQSIGNEDVQKLLHVSQSTATNYLAELSSSGMLRREGIRGGTRYSL